MRKASWGRSLRCLAGHAWWQTCAPQNSPVSVALEMRLTHPSDTRFSRNWIGRKQQVDYAVREHLPAEEVKLGQLIADCKLVMEEMNLIESARADSSQDVTVQHGHNSR